ncbi:MAG: hypothetical protein FWB96_03540, partial [Defluviitaleaceae bacterium]|nr:hypothetical protein [Defluviitaleaceae bacterium]MCL2262175.1 hypothetical protein [Defluviitaleaceae bacterium]
PPSGSSRVTVHHANVLKLAYSNVEFDFTIRDDNGNLMAVPGIVCPAGQSFEIVPRTLADWDAYTPPENSGSGGFVVHYISCTGELVFSDAAKAAFQDGTRITYFKEGFRRGDLNPWVYFDAIEVTGRFAPEAELALVDPPVLPNGQFNFMVNVDGGLHPGLFDISQNSDISPVIVINGEEFRVWEDLEQLPQARDGDTWENVFWLDQGGIDINIIQRVAKCNETHTFSIDFSVINYAGEPIEFNFRKYANTGLEGPDGYSQLVFAQGGVAVQPNPELYPEGTLRLALSSEGVLGEEGFPAVWQGAVALPDDAVTFSSTIRVELIERLIPGAVNDLDEQWIRYETSSGVHSRINDKARHIYTDKMFADFRRIVEFAESISLSDPRELEAYFRNPPHNKTGDALTNAVAEKIAIEAAKANAVLHDRFNNMLGLLQRHTQSIVAEHIQCVTVCRRAVSISSQFRYRLASL